MRLPLVKFEVRIYAPDDTDQEDALAEYEKRHVPGMVRRFVEGALAGMDRMRAEVVQPDADACPDCGGQHEGRRCG